MGGWFMSECSSHGSAICVEEARDPTLFDVRPPKTRIRLCSSTCSVVTVVLERSMNVLLLHPAG